MRRIFATACLWLAALAPAAAQDDAARAEAVRGVMQQAIAEHVVPSYTGFEAAAEELDGAVAALCERPGADALAAAREAFARTARAWAGIEFVRFGPVMSQNRLERVLFWPDRKSIGLKQVQRALAESDPSAAEPGSLAGKSVAMQGLGAIEFLLFGSGADDLASDGVYRCRYAAAASANVRDIAGEIVAGWTTEDGATRDSLALAGTGDALPSLNELIATLVHGLEAVRDIRLRGFLDVAQGDDRPKGALFWRSNRTLPALRANVAGLRAFFERSGMRTLLPDDAASVADSAGFEFAQLDKLLSGEAAIAEVLADSERRRPLVVADLVLGSLIERLDTQYAPAAGLSAGFSFADGD